MPGRSFKARRQVLQSWLWVRIDTPEGPPLGAVLDGVQPLAARSAFRYFDGANKVSRVIISVRFGTHEEI